MTIQIENEYTGSFEVAYEEIAHAVIQEALKVETCPYEAEVNLVLTTDEEIRKMNKRFRSIDKVTDVLSFPMIPFPYPADYGIIVEMEDDCLNPDTKELMLGDIMIAIPRLKEQAALYGHSQTREYAFLIAHSMLHLLGYDHMSEEEAATMERKQEEILEHLDIKR